MTEKISSDTVWHAGHVTAEERAVLLGQQAATFWFTGLSGAGKSTLAFLLERELVNSGRACYVLDGDNVRHGLNRDLGFSSTNRSENIRRISEVAKLMNEAGLIVIAAFISPYRTDRAMAREIIGTDRFFEVHLTTPIEVCEQRDVKGMYKKARAGLITDFTGISAPYEPPETPLLEIDTSKVSCEEAISKLIGLLPARE